MTNVDECSDKLKLITINNNVLISKIHNKLKKNVKNRWCKIIKDILYRIYMLNLRYIKGYYLDYYEQINNILIY